MQGWPRLRVVVWELGWRGKRFGRGLEEESEAGVLKR